MSDHDHERCVPEEVFESRLNESMFAHSAATYEAVVNQLLERAKLRFARGDDRVATFLRDELVPDYRRMAAELRRKQDEESKKLLKEGV